MPLTTAAFSSAPLTIWTWQVAAISKSARVRRAPGRAKPSSSHGWYIPAELGV
jgi:hypothetical protein